ncbi:MAG: 50S ribosomal protein L21 [Spirochaetia bacterium]|jgi:large subunit ribosomal protein L21|nr:50S ribosomal protein L21 [Spirochaetia bacterium]
MYALVEIKGKQYKAEKGSVLRIDRVELEKGNELEFDKVLMLRGDKDDIKIGMPYLEGVKVQAVVEDQIRDKKVVVFKYKKRKNYRRTKGHKQPYTMIKVSEITGA